MVLVLRAGWGGEREGAWGGSPVNPSRAVKGSISTMPVLPPCVHPREIQGIKGGRRMTRVADQATLLADEGTKAPGSEGQTLLVAL